MADVEDHSTWLEERTAAMLSTVDYLLMGPYLIGRLVGDWPPWTRLRVVGGPGSHWHLKASANPSRLGDARDLLLGPAADYFLHESQWPDRLERVKLAHRVNAVLRCYCYSSQHVYMHFAHLRGREKRFSEGCRPGSPSLDPDPQRKGADMRMGGTTRKHSVVAKLDVLLEEEPSPTPEVAAIWADVLAQGVLAEDILTYALLRQVKRHVGEGDTVCAATSTQASSSGSLPSSTSELAGSLKQSPSQPPRAPPQLPSTSSSSACPETIPSSGDASRLDPGSPLVCFLSGEGYELVQRLRHALSAPASPHPKTFSELFTWLSSWFRQRDRVIEHFRTDRPSGRVHK
ncbi:hypothetical protein V8D89_011005 [Ganoderma adspersum]